MATDDRPIIRVIGFHTTYERMPVRGTDPLNDEVDAQGFLVDAKGRRIMETVATDWATYAPAHAPLTVKNTERVRQLIPDPQRMGNDDDGAKLAFMSARWAQIEPAYAAWKSGQEVPVNGTPLASWPGVNSAQVEVLRAVGLRTVEEVRDLAETALDRIRLPNVRDLRTQARLFLERQGDAEAAAREAAMRQQMEDMQAQMAELRAELAARPAAKPDDADEEVVDLRRQLDAAGIAYDGRWAAPKLRAALASAVEKAA